MNSQAHNNFKCLFSPLYELDEGLMIWTQH